MFFASRRPFSITLPSGRALTLGDRCLLMGILNVTPDSFAEPTSKMDLGVAVEAGLRLEREGADLIDVGGESTRPGAEPVSVDEELSRIVPVITRLANRLTVPISVDTYKSEVAREAIAAGASMVNDISGLRNDQAMGRAVAETGAALVIMHTRGSSKAMYAEAIYGDVVTEVITELRERIDSAVAIGIPRDRLVVDPGIGFAKQPAHSYGVLARLPELAAALGLPLLVGPSRKSFLRQALYNRPAVQRDWGTAAAVTAAVLAGAHIVRVHAVEEMSQVVRVAEAIRTHALRPVSKGTSG